jgi:YbbR domain-containing protein
MKRMWLRLEESSPVIPFIRDNLGWIAISLVLAIMIWVVATLDENPIEQREFVSSIDINFLENNDDEVILNRTSITTEAKVTLRAPVKSWLELVPEDIEVHADLQGLPVGVHTVKLEASIRDNGPSGRVISVSPATIRVEIVPFQERRFSVDVIVSTRFNSAEYNVDKSTCEGQEVVVSGPAELVDRVAKAELRIVVINPENPNPSTRPVTLINTADSEFTSTQLDNIKIVPERLTCEVDVQQIENVLRVEPNVVGAPPPGYLIGEITHTPEVVLVSGDSSLIEALNGVVQTAEVDTSNQIGQFSREVNVVLPAGVTTSQRITVTVDIIPVQTTLQIPEVPVQITNLDPSFTASVLPETVNVTLAGPEPLIQNVTIEDLSVTVDVSGLSEGTHTGLTAQVNLLQATLQEDVIGTAQPNNVTVVITLTSSETPALSPTPRLRVWGKVVP